MNMMRIITKTMVWKALLLFPMMIFAILAMQLFMFSEISEENDVDHLREFNDSYKIFSLTLPQQMNFCGESVPLEKIHVRESLDRELLVNTYWQSSSILNHKRASRWFPRISEILREEGVPDDLKYIALVESGLTNVVSPAGATGFWQFMRSTGAEYGLEINGEVDERYHVEKATRAACRYLKDAYQKYSSWTLAAASYNMGMNGLDKQLARQKTKDYYELLLVEETSRYVFRALALKEIVNDPGRYGFHIREKDLYLPYNTTSIQLNGPVESFADFAHENGTDYKTLKVLNPWLRDNFLTNRTGKTYTVLLPGKNFNDLPDRK